MKIWIDTLVTVIGKVIKDGRCSYFRYDSIHHTLFLLVNINVYILPSLIWIYLLSYTTSLLYMLGPELVYKHVLLYSCLKAIRY